MERVGISTFRDALVKTSLLNVFNQLIKYLALQFQLGVPLWEGNVALLSSLIGILR